MPSVSGVYAGRVFLSIVAMAALASCADEEPYRVGFSSTLSGTESSFGIDIRDGALLAVEDLNARTDGTPLELVIRDDRGDPDDALRNNREFADMGLEVVIGHATSALVTAVLPFLESRDMVFVGASISSPAFTDLDDALFRVATTSRVETAILARHLIETRGPQTIAAIYDGSNLAYAEPFYEDFKREYEGMGGRVADPVVYTVGSARYAELVQRAIAAAAEVQGLFLITNPIHSAALSQLYRQA
ncbi:MAG: ABC transporter substrate-binding protein, partial [Spirochaetales bacterium]|nr:ABC transporter substrate-binding protein [Spirochaetales bacterium]